MSDGGQEGESTIGRMGRRQGIGIVREGSCCDGVGRERGRTGSGCPGTGV